MKLFGQEYLIEEDSRKSKLDPTALSHLESLVLPTTSEEDWRYGAIETLNFSKVRSINVVSDERDRELQAAAALWEGRLGQSFDYVIGVVGSHVRVLRAGRRPEVTVGERESSVATCRSLMTEPFADIADLLSTRICEVRIARGESELGEAPKIMIVGLAGGDNEVSTASVSVIVEAGARAMVAEVHVGGGDDTVHLSRTTVAVGAEGDLSLLTLQDIHDRSTELGHLDISVDRDGVFRSLHLALGSQYGRLRTQCDLVGEGAQAELLAGYLGGNHQTLEFRTFQNHDARNTKSNLLYKGALAGASHAIYTGTIKVSKGASGSTAFQTNRNLILGDDALADSVPNLDIEENDVKCSHASAVGPVDRDQVYYLESKGIDGEKAERMIVGGSFRDLVSSAGYDPLRQVLEERLVVKW
jgi:Fe-S cluster assembly protein SufD